MRLRVYFLTVIACFMIRSATGLAEEHSATYTVRPGDNGTRVLSNGAKKGDTMTVTFKAASGYALVSASADNSDFEWTKVSDFSFTATITTDLIPQSSHQTKFSGKMRPIGPGNGPDVLLDWNMTSTVNALGNHEGVGTFNRDPAGTMTTRKPGNAPVTNGVATFDEKTGKFVGTFDGYLGQYSPTVPYCASGTATPKETKSEEIDCPDCGQVKVIKVYYVCGDSEFGGMTDPDKIELNTYTVEPQLGQQKAALKTLLEQKAKTEADLAAAQKELQEAQKKKAECQEKFDKALADAIDKLTKKEQQAVEKAEATVKKKEEALAAAQKKLDDKLASLTTLNNNLAAAQRDLAAAQQELAAAQQELAAATTAKERKAAQNKIDAANRKIAAAQKRINTIQEKISDATKPEQDQVNKANNALQKAQKALEAAQENLETAKATADTEARKTPAVIAAQQALDTAKAAVAAAEAAIKQAEALLAEIANKIQLAEAEIAKLEGIQKAWDDGTPDLIAHEKEHRAICYHFADQLTDFLNSFGVYAYATTKNRAVELAKSYFNEKYMSTVQQIREKADETQNRFDSVTDHGIHPEKWDHDKEVQ